MSLLCFFMDLRITGNKYDMEVIKHMSKIDIACSDYIQQPYVIASLFQSALLDDNDVIMESDVVL